MNNRPIEIPRIRQELEVLFNLYSRGIPRHPDNHVARNYTDLCERAKEDELRNAINFLREPISGATDVAILQEFIRAYFLLCANENHDTLLSFFAAVPERENGRLNLYWQTATKLFQPQTFTEMMAILTPNITQVLVPTFTLINPQLPPNVDNLNVTLTLQPINEEASDDANLVSALPMELASFQSLVAHDNYVLNLETFTTMSFEFHQKMYQALAAYPELREKVYRHNRDFKNLELDLNMVERDATTPRAAIEALIPRLRMEGRGYRGNEFVNDGSLMAEFLIYLERLPAPLKANLLACSGDYYGTPTTLDYVVNTHLIGRGGCVELAARMFTGILENHANDAILDTLPNLTEEELQAIRNKYSQNENERPLFHKGHDNSKRLPAAIQASNIAQLSMGDVRDFTDLLTQIPVDQIDAFLPRCTFNMQPRLVREVGVALLSTNVLNAEQLTHFFNAALNHPEQLGGLHNIILLAIYSKRADKLLQVIQHIQADPTLDCAALFTQPIQIYDGNETTEMSAFDFLMHADNDDMLVHLIDPLAATEAGRRLFQANDRATGLPIMLARALQTNNLAMLQRWINSIPPEQRLREFTAARSRPARRNNRGNTVSFNIMQAITFIDQPADFVNALMLSLPDDDARLAAITQVMPNNPVYGFYDGKNLIHGAIARNRIEIINQLLNLLPPALRLRALNSQTGNGETALHVAARMGTGNGGGIGLFNAVLNLYPQGPQRNNALLHRDTRGNNILHAACPIDAANPNLLCAVHDALPDDATRELLLMQRNQDGAIVLHNLLRSNSVAAYQQIPRVLALYPIHARMHALESFRGDPQTGLAKIRFVLDVSLAVLDLLPDANKLNLIIEPSGDLHCETMLQQCVRASDLAGFNRVLNSLNNQTDRQIALTTQHQRSEPLLITAARTGNVALFNAVYAAFAVPHITAALLACNSLADDVLKTALQSGNVAMINSVLAKYPAKARIESLIVHLPHLLNAIEMNNRHDSNRDAVRIIEAILSHLNEKHLRELLAARDGQRSLLATTLKLFATNQQQGTDLICRLIAALPKQDRWQQLSQNSDALVDMFLNDSSSRHPAGTFQLAYRLLDLLPEEHQLMMMKTRVCGTDLPLLHGLHMIDNKDLYAELNRRIHITAKALELNKLCKNYQLHLKKTILQQLADMKASPNIIQAWMQFDPSNTTNMPALPANMSANLQDSANKMRALCDLTTNLRASNQTSISKVRNFNTAFDQHKAVLAKNPDSAGRRFLKAVGHILASVFSLGIYAGVRAAISYKKYGTATFWQSSARRRTDEIQRTQSRFRYSITAA